MRQLFVALGLAVLATTSYAGAQAVQPPTVRIPAPAQPVVPAPPASVQAMIAVPPNPQVDDPMLAPIAAPARTITSWREAIDTLRARSTNLKVALDQVLQAEAQTTIAIAQYLPSLSGCGGGTQTTGCANGSYTHQLLTRTVATQGVNGIANTGKLPVPNMLSGSVTATQNIINVQEFDQISINELAEDATHLTVDDTKRTLALSLANQIVSVVTAERSAELNRVGLRVALEQLDITVRKERLGSATGLDVVRAKQNAANARATLVVGDETLREAREALGLALGFPEEVGVSPSIRVDGLAETAETSCHVVANADDRPDVQAARTNMEVAQRNLRNVWFTFLPTLAAQSTLSATSVAPTGYPNPTWSIQGVLAVPIWDGGTRIGNAKYARAAADIAAQNLETLRRQVILQVVQAKRGIEVAEVEDKVAREQRDLAALNDQMTQAAYARGQGTSVDLVTASEAHRQAELSLALADYNTVKARVAALLALATCQW